MYTSRAPSIQLTHDAPCTEMYDETPLCQDHFRRTQKYCAPPTHDSRSPPSVPRGCCASSPHCRAHPARHSAASRGVQILVTYRSSPYGVDQTWDQIILCVARNVKMRSRAVDIATCCKAHALGDFVRVVQEHLHPRVLRRQLRRHLYAALQGLRRAVRAARLAPGRFPFASL
jgi:hypothetical protein